MYNYDRYNRKGAVIMKKQLAKRLLSCLLVFVMLLGVMPVMAAQTAAEVYDLRVNDLESPVGLDDPTPAFSWKMKSDSIGAAQTAYAITVSDGEKNLWDTGWVESSDSIAIPYEGEALQAAETYTVSVRIRDEKGVETQSVQTAFEMGLMEEKPLSDAKWISWQAYAGTSDDLTSYSIDFDFIIDNTVQGFCFSMTDASNLFMWQVNAHPAVGNGKVLLRPHIKSAGNWTVLSAVDLTALTGYTAESIVGKTVHERIVVEDTTVTMYLSDTEGKLVQVSSYDHGVAVPLRNLGFRHTTDNAGSKDIARYDNFVVKDKNGLVVSAEDFSGDVTLTGSTHYAVVDGMLRVGAEEAVGEQVSILQKKAASVENYTIDFDFVLESGSQGFCLNMTDPDSFFLWQVNTVNGKDTKSVLLRPHISSNNSWTATPGSGTSNVDITAAIGYDTDTIFGKTIHERIEVEGKTIRTYFGPSADQLTLAHEFTHKNTIPFANLGFRHYSDQYTVDLAAYDNIVVRDEAGEILYAQDFSQPVELTGHQYYTVENGTLKVGTTTLVGEQRSMLRLREEEEAANANSAPAFRKPFTPKAGLVSAKLYTSGLGVYENYINGQRVGRLMDDGSIRYDELKPGFTEGTKRMFYNTCDVTWMLREEEENVLGAVVTTGWWNAAESNMRQGNESAYLAKLVLTYEDGTKETIVTDTTWQTAKAGAVLASTGIFGGEDYDARVDQSWMLPNFTGTEWGTPKISTEFKGAISAWQGETVLIREDLERIPVDMYVYEGVTGAASGYYGTVNKVATYEDGQDITLNPGQTLLVNFGQNFVGWEAFAVTSEEGTAIHVEHGEWLNDGNGATSRGNDGPEGSVYNANYRAAKAETDYITAGGEYESWHPSFSFYGFQYAAFTADKPVTFHQIRGQVVTSVRHDTAWLETSDADVNQLLSNSRWGMYGNYLSVPTDCPQRNERQGWLGDTQVFSETGMFLGENKSFLRKAMQDIRDCQNVNASSGDYGGFPSVAPNYKNYGGFGAIGWADGGIIVPYNLYVMYGDTEVIEENWAAMELYMDFLSRQTYGGKHNYGDWLSYEANSTATKNMLGVCFHAWDARMMVTMAKAIGNEEAAAKYQAVYEAKKAQYQREFVQADGTVKEGTQAVCLYALYVDMVENEAAVADQLIANIERNGNKLQTGFLGTAILLPTLTKIGRSDVAYKLLLQHDDPSWLYSVDQGATSIWERWNTYTIANGFGPVSMNSFNHYAYGAVAAWMLRGMAGIGYDTENPGFRHILLNPAPDASLGTVHATYESAYGPIVSNMDMDGNVWDYEAAIPANTTATIRLPLENGCVVTVNGKAAEAVSLAEDGLVLTETTEDVMVFEAVAGTFRFHREQDPVYAATEQAEAALRNLVPYQSTVSVTSTNKAAVQTLVDEAKAAVAACEALGAAAADLKGYDLLKGAEAALVADALYQTDHYTIELTTVVDSRVQGFAFGMPDPDTFLMWQLNLAYKPTDTTLRPHVQVNGAWVGSQTIAITDFMGAPADLTGKTIYERFEVNGAEIKTYMGLNPDDMVLVNTYTHTAPATLLGIGARHDCPNPQLPETATYDNIVIRDGAGNLIYEEDFSDPAKVAIAGNGSATAYAFVDGALQLGAVTSALSEQHYRFGKANAFEAGVELAETRIEAIGEVTAESEPRILAAREAVNVLTEAQKQAVSNLAVLEAAEQRFATIGSEVALVLTGADSIHAFEEEVVYTFSAKNMTNLANMIVSFGITEEYLTDPVVEAAEGWMIVAQSWKNGVLSVALGNTAGANGEGDILTITLKPKEVAGEASVAVTFAELTAYLGDGETFVNANLDEAAITTQVKYNIYDVNRDGVVDQLDMTRAQRHYGSDFADADVNSDGEVNIDDLILILNHFHEEFA